MRKLLYLIIYLPLLLLTACDVHEWPDTPEYVKMHLRLNYETGIILWYHQYDGESITEVGLGDKYDNHQAYGKIRYIVRAYPISEKQRLSKDYTHEFTFTKDIAKGYDHEVTLDLLPGEYNIMVWSDLQQTSDNPYFYNPSTFAEIRLQGEHKASDDYRDAFRGTKSITLVSDIMEHLPDTLNITMQRPLSKYEFITNDVKEFVEKEAIRLESKANVGNTGTPDDVPTRVVNIEDYKVVFYYVGFMPNAYSIHTDKPVDSATGVMFESGLKKLTESEASIGFDYVFVNSNQSAVTVKIGIYDNKGTELSLSEAIEVPLRRSHNTILTSMFLMSEASGGVTINPDFEGDHNLIFP